jgi:hypothetical protein
MWSNVEQCGAWDAGALLGLRGLLVVFVWWGRVGVGCRSDVLWMLAWFGVSSGSGVRLLMPRVVV